MKESTTRRADSRDVLASLRLTVPASLRLAALALVLAASACAGTAGWLSTYPDVAARAHSDPGSFLPTALAQWDDLEAMVGSYQVRASRGINSRTLDTQIYLLRDALVQIEVLAPTFTSEGFVGVSAREVGLWVAEDPCLYRGPNEPGAFGRALGIDLAPEQIVAALFGYAVPDAGNARAIWDEAERRIRVSAGTTSAWLHPVTLRFERAVIDTASGPISIEYQSWAEQGPPVPLRLRVEVAGEDITLQLRLAPEWGANPPGLDRAFFDQLPPIDDAVDCRLDELVIDGGLLRRGLSR